MKTCRICKEDKQPEEFYTMKKNRDGLDHRCKECVKKSVRSYYRRTRPERIQYEKEREKDPERKRKKLEYQRKRRHRDKIKYMARTYLNNAIRDGRAQKGPCEKCGDPNAEAHHRDYMNPLDVRWLCRKHHLAEHGKESY